MKKRLFLSSIGGLTSCLATVAIGGTNYLQAETPIVEILTIDPIPEQSFSNKENIISVSGQVSFQGNVPLTISVIIDGEEKITEALTEDNFSLDINTQGLRAGSHSIVVVISDEEGNQAEKETTFSIKNNIPTISFTLDRTIFKESEDILCHVKVFDADIGQNLAIYGYSDSSHISLSNGSEEEPSDGEELKQTVSTGKVQSFDITLKSDIFSFVSNCIICLSVDDGTDVIHSEKIPITIIPSSEIPVVEIDEYSKAQSYQYSLIGRPYNVSGQIANVIPDKPITVTATIDGKNIPSGYIDYNNGKYVIDMSTSNFAIGEHKIVVTASSGEISTDAEAVITIVNTAPSIKIENTVPTEEENYLDFSSVITDINDGQKMTVEYSIDDSPFTYLEKFRSAGINNNKYTIELPVLDEGPHSLKLKVNDGFEESEAETSFTIYRNNSSFEAFPITLKVYDNQDATLKGVTILIKNADKKTVATVETDKRGEVELELNPGKYTYVVTNVPDGYICPPASHVFTVADDGKVSGTKSVTIDISEVTLKKLDSITKDGIADVSLVIKNENKEIVGSGVTDSKGELTVTGLPAGDYTYSEKLSASGYAFDEGVYKFSIDKNGKVSGTTTTTSNPILIVFTVKDYASGKGLAGATLQIKNQFGSTIASVTTDNKGEASVSGLTSGKYTLSQSEASQGYIKSTDEYTFDVLNSGLVSGTTEFSNKPAEQSPPPAITQTNIPDNTNRPQNIQQQSLIPSPTNETEIISSQPIRPSPVLEGDKSSPATTDTIVTTTPPSDTDENPQSVKTGVELTHSENRTSGIAAIVGAISTLLVTTITIVKNKSTEH